MPIATYLLIVSGVASVALTIWGRIVPPGSRLTRMAFIGVGAVSVICIVAAGMLNSASQRNSTEAQGRLTDTINTMAENVSKLAAPAKVDPALTTDQILAAAASKLIEQQKRIDRLEDQQREDHSAKRMIRDLLMRADSRIPAAIDAGKTRIEFHMQPQDFDSLQALANQPDASNLTHILQATHSDSRNSINCGSPNGICPGSQVDVIIEALPDLKR